MPGRYLLDTNAVIALFADSSDTSQYNLTLMTRDGHFDGLHGLMIEGW